MRRSGGIEAEASYPYASGSSGAEPACKAVADDFVLGLEAGPARTIARESRAVGEHAMALHVNSTGPLTVREGGVSVGVRGFALLNICSEQTLAFFEDRFFYCLLLFVSFLTFSLVSLSLNFSVKFSSLLIVPLPRSAWMRRTGTPTWAVCCPCEVALASTIVRK